MFYEGFADSYDEMINWPSRLASEQNDLKNLFGELKVKKILDAGCGTGIHAIIFSKMGLKVTGVDNSEMMLEKAKENTKKYNTPKVNFVLGEFTKLDSAVKGPFDVVACLGNSLPHLVQDTDIVIALEKFYKLLRPGGLCMIQMVHFDHYLDSSDSAVAVTDGLRHGREVTFRRHYEFKGTKVIFHVSVYDSKQKELLEDFSSPLNAIRRELLENFMIKAGFEELSAYSDFAKNPLTDEDRSLVILAYRPRA